MHEHNNGTKGVHRLTKNNYFYSKLLTVEDMATEQAYHSGVQRTLSRFITDWGRVCGLNVDTDKITDDETGQESLVVTVSEGLALDRCGRLIVVGDEQRKTVTLPPTAGGSETDVVAVYVQYDECFTDPVPAAKMENACEEECKDNRIVEDAEVTLEPGDPGDYHKSIAEVDFPTAEELGLGGEIAGQTLTVRGDIEVRFGEVSDLEVAFEEADRLGLEVMLSDSAPSGTVLADITIPESSEDPTIDGSIQVPSASLIGPEGFTLPDGTFDVDASLRFSDGEPTPIEGTLTATPNEDTVGFEGTLTESPATPDETEYSVSFTFDVLDGSLAVDGSVEGPKIEVTVENDLDISDRDESYVLDGQLKVQVRETGRESEPRVGIISTVPWSDGEEEVAGVLVDKPETSTASPADEADIDAVLAGLARSYYRNEPRTACGGVDEGPVLIGTLTAEAGDWSSIAFDSGPLVYTNDMLFDILARHVSAFDNPHGTSLGVGMGNGNGADAQVGIEEPEGLTGSVGLTSTDDSIEITPNHQHDTVDLAARGGLGDAVEEYYVFEKSLWTKIETYTEIVRQAPKHQVPQEARVAAFQIVQLSMKGLEDEVYASGADYVEFLRGESGPRLNLAAISQAGILQLENRVINLLNIHPNDQPVTIRLAQRSYQKLPQLVQQYVETGEGAVEIAMAQDRVAEAARVLLLGAPTAQPGEEAEGSVGVIAEATVPNVTWSNAGKGSEDSIRELWQQGWVHQIEPVRPDIDETAELTDGRVNSSVAQSLTAGTVATKPAIVTIDVIAPPLAKRIDGIGRIHAKELDQAGIETISELSIATPSAIRVLTDVSQERAEALQDTARGYADAYSLTRFDQIGSAEAEALWEARGWTYYGSLPSLEEYDTLLEDLNTEVSDGTLKGKYRDRIEAMNWQAVRASISQLEDE